MILGLTGYAGVGKDTAAEYLVKEFNFTRVAFADKLRQLAYNINPYIHHEVPGLSHRLVGIVDEMGWDRAKREIIAIREFLQGTGHGARLTFGDPFWIQAAFTPEVLQNTDIVVTDVRYENEVKYIADLGGYIIRIQRDGFGPINDHITEKELAYDYIITNDNVSKSYLHYSLSELVVGLRRLENYQS
jgi:uncharacterized protein with PIN domain